MGPDTSIIFPSAESALRARADETAHVWEQQVWTMEAKLKGSPSQPNLLRQLAGLRFNVDRVRRFNARKGANLQCFTCWMHDERESALFPIREDAGRYHSYRCKHCGRDWQWQYR